MCPRQRGRRTAMAAALNGFRYCRRCAEAAKVTKAAQGNSIYAGRRRAWVITRGNVDFRARHRDRRERSAGHCVRTRLQWKHGCKRVRKTRCHWQSRANADGTWTRERAGIASATGARVGVSFAWLSHGVEVDVRVASLNIATGPSPRRATTDSSGRNGMNASCARDCKSP